MITNKIDNLITASRIVLDALDANIINTTLSMDVYKGREMLRIALEEVESE